MATADDGGQIQQIAKTFGVDWSHLVAQIISFSIVCFLLHRFAYKPVLKMLEERRQQIAQGLANTKRSQPNWPGPRAQRQEIMMQANARRPTDRRSPRRSRSSPGAGNQKAIAAAEQIVVKAREAAAQEHARMLTELKA